MMVADGRMKRSKTWYAGKVAAAMTVRRQIWASFAWSLFKAIHGRKMGGKCRKQACLVLRFLEALTLSSRSFKFTFGVLPRGGPMFWWAVASSLPFDVISRLQFTSQREKWMAIRRREES
jgi:hypothetical protein